MEVWKTDDSRVNFEKRFARHSYLHDNKQVELNP